MEFTEFLRLRELLPTTVDYHMRCFRCVERWCSSVNIEIGSMTYNDVIMFIKFCKERGVSILRINKLLCTARYYFDYLCVCGAVNENPLSGLIIKGAVKKIPVNTMDASELDSLYRDYSIQLSVRASKKVMAGFMIYQGVTPFEITNIRLCHVKIKERKIIIPATNLTNGRVLDLQPQQLPLLCRYIQTNDPKDCFFLKSRTNENSYKCTMNHKMKNIFCQLKRLNAKSYNSRCIRASVITEWLKKQNIRQVQYMSGLKHISSVEFYQSGNLDELQQDLKNFHPMA